MTIFVLIKNLTPKYARIKIKEENKLQRQKILIFIYPIYNHNWKNISKVKVSRNRPRWPKGFLVG